jgi:hypothetical protein
MKITVKHDMTRITVDEVKEESSIRYHVEEIKKILDKVVESINNLRGNKT